MRNWNFWLLSKMLILLWLPVMCLCLVCMVSLNIIEPSSPNKQQRQEMIVHTIGNNRGHSDRTCTRLWVKWLLPLACKNLQCPRGYSEEEKGLQQFSSRAATMTTDIYRPTKITQDYVPSWKLQVWIDGSISLFCQTPCLLERWSNKSALNCLAWPVHLLFQFSGSRMVIVDILRSQPD